MKALFVHHNSSLGGAERSLYELVCELAEQGIDPVVVLPGTGMLQESLEMAGIRCRTVDMVRLRRSSNPLQLVRMGVTWKRISALLRGVFAEERPEVIHANSRTSCLYAYPGANALAIPLLWHERDLAPLGVIEKSLSKHVSGIIGISECVKANLSKHLGSTVNISVILNGINHSRFLQKEAFVSRGDLGLPGSGPVILMAAQFVPWKKHDVFLQAAVRVREAFPDAMFVLAGNTDGEGERDYVDSIRETVVELGLSESVVFPGFVTDMDSMLHHASCVCLASEREPFGRIVVEAMAAETPVVAINSCGPAEIVRDGIDGFLVGPGDAQEMANAIIGILDSPERAARMGKAGRQRAVSDFAVSRVAGSVIKMYEEFRHRV